MMLNRCKKVYTDPRVTPQRRVQEELSRVRVGAEGVR
jgi:hypothetical protein